MGVALAGSVAALVATLTLIGQDARVMFGGMFVVDAFTAAVPDLLPRRSAIVVLALSLRYFRDGRYYQGEYYFLLLTSFLGCLLMPGSRDLVMLFISLELVSAPGFLIAAFRKGDPRSNEAGLKFFLIGVLSAAVMLYGMSMIYGITGQTRLVGDRTRARHGEPRQQGIAAARRRSCSSSSGSRSRSPRCRSSSGRRTPTRARRCRSRRSWRWRRRRPASPGCSS